MAHTRETAFHPLRQRRAGEPAPASARHGKEVVHPKAKPVSHHSLSDQIHGGSATSPGSGASSRPPAKARRRNHTLRTNLPELCVAMRPRPPGSPAPKHEAIQSEVLVEAIQARKPKTNPRRCQPKLPPTPVSPRAPHRALDRSREPPCPHKGHRSDRRPKPPAEPQHRQPEARSKGPCCAPTKRPSKPARDPKVAIPSQQHCASSGSLRSVPVWVEIERLKPKFPPSQQDHRGPGQGSPEGFPQARQVRSDDQTPKGAQYEHRVKRFESMAQAADSDDEDAPKRHHPACNQTDREPGNHRFLSNIFWDVKDRLNQKPTRPLWSRHPAYQIGRAHV